MPATSRTLQHVGEWKLEVCGATIEELFTEVARILADAAGPRRPTDTPRAWERVELKAPDDATLLVDWANELIGRSEVAGRAYGGVRNLVVGSASDGAARLSADVRGDPVDEWVSPVKAATYHDAVVAHDGSEWHAVVLLDV